MIIIRVRNLSLVIAAVFLAAIGYQGASIVSGSRNIPSDKSRNPDSPSATAAVIGPPLEYHRRYVVDMAGYELMNKLVPAWKPDATLEEIAEVWRGFAMRTVGKADRKLAAQPNMPLKEKYAGLNAKVALLNYEGFPEKAYQTLQELRALVESDEEMNHEFLYTVIYMQGVTALRRGENENCIMCRGESSCIIPISPAALHVNPEGSRLAIQHFTEYLTRFPEDLGVRWLMNIAHMTLGEHPHKVDPRYLVSLDHFTRDEFNIGRFRDIGHVVGANQLTQAGGAIMEDFDNDGHLDLVITSFDPTCQMNLLHNTGHGTFEDQTTNSGLLGQFGGLNCVQTDYNNDGQMDIFVVRGAWLAHPIRPSLLRNDGNGRFTDMTKEVGLLDAVNSISASWRDYDNDGWLDLFICCERQPSRLYHNLGNGKFEEVFVKAGLSSADLIDCKGSAWLDYDQDGFPDLFLNHLMPIEGGRLYHNDRDGTFHEVTQSMGIDGPVAGFSCWAWDYDNDGWEDIFATCFERSPEDIVHGLVGEPHSLHSCRLYHNMHGQRFQDESKTAGLDKVYSTMGSNFGDFDNDGFLDFYLGTGEPDLATLVPNRMFKNVAGQRFAEITASSGTGNLQKGHGVACGDWDRDGNVDIFIEMGGAVNGDKYHNILFQNPGHDNHWLTVKLTGKKSNRASIGARIKIVTAGTSPRTFYRHVSSGSSFGANPLQQTIGLAKADEIAVLEIHWPTSGTTQVFHNIAVDQAIAITEFDVDYQRLNWNPVSIPASDPPAKTRAAGR